MALQDESYEIVNTEKIFQGDFIKKCPNFLVPPGWTRGSDVKVPVKVYPNVIVLTQTCDIEHDKADNILVAPVDDVSVFARNNEDVNIIRNEVNANKNGIRLISTCTCLIKATITPIITLAATRTLKILASRELASLDSCSGVIRPHSKVISMVGYLSLISIILPPSFRPL